MVNYVSRLERLKLMQKLIKLRKRMGLSQDKMAELLGYGSGIRISEIESGKVKMSKPAKKCLEYLELLYVNDLME